MIKGKKRTAEKTASNDEPIKKKSPKLDSKQRTKSNNSKNGSKNEKPPNKIGAAKFGKKFDGKSGKKDAPNQPNEKTDWRKFKQDKKELKVKRKQSKDSYQISIEAKQIYEKLKCRRTEKKNELVEKLYNLLGSDDIIKKMVMAHDTARIIQCMLKFASPAVRDQISEKLLPLSIDMSVSKYSHFCVLRMFKYGSPSIKTKLVDAFLGNIVKLACHTISSKILDLAYLTVASPKQKIFMRQEFYGDLYKKAKDNNVQQLADTYKDTPAMKASILGSVKSNLEHVANKQLLDNSLVHAVILEYLRECNEENIEEAVTMFATLIPLMVTTKDGCQAAISCFYKATSKNRRAIIKAIKEHLVKICNHEHGHIFILAVLNSLDDTKATKKAIYDTIHPELNALATNQWGRSVIQWLISPADTNCFHPSFIATIEEGLQYGKKDKEIRRKEILEEIEGPIATTIVEEPEFWISNGHIGLVTAEILKKINIENFEKVALALTTIIVQPSWSVTSEEVCKEKSSTKSHDVEKIIADATKQKKTKQKNVKTQFTEDTSDNDEENPPEKEKAIVTGAGIEDAGMHIVLKKIIKNDKERLAENSGSKTFSSFLVQQLPEETIKYWLTVNRGCFILLNIVENNNEDTIDALKKLVKVQEATLRKQTTSGAKLLLKKLEL